MFLILAILMYRLAFYHFKLEFHDNFDINHTLWDFG